MVTVGHHQPFPVNLHPGRDVPYLFCWTLGELRQDSAACGRNTRREGIFTPNVYAGDRKFQREPSGGSTPSGRTARPVQLLRTIHYGWNQQSNTHKFSWISRPDTTVQELDFPGSVHEKVFGEPAIPPVLWK